MSESVTTEQRVSFSFTEEESQALWYAAAAVANAIAVGTGGCIQGTLMEAELRQALKLRPGELVEIPR